MPLYDFKCPNCGHVEKDALVPRDKRVIKCPKCGADMERKIGAGHFRINGRRDKIV